MAFLGRMNFHIYYYILSFSPTVSDSIVGGMSTFLLWRPDMKLVITWMDKKIKPVDDILETTYLFYTVFLELPFCTNVRHTEQHIEQNSLQARS